MKLYLSSKYLQEPEYQKKITVQLNKGGSLTRPPTWCFSSPMKAKSAIGLQENQQSGNVFELGFVNTITIWNTVYMQTAIDQLKAEGYEVKRKMLKELSPIEVNILICMADSLFQCRRRFEKKKSYGNWEAGKQSSLEIILKFKANLSGIVKSVPLL